MNPLDSEFESVPSPVWGSPMQHSRTEDGQVVRANAPGFLHSPPALRLLLFGLLLSAAGLFVIGGAAFASFREFEIGSVFAFLIGGGVGALITWLGIAGIRWAVAAAWGVTEITITADMLQVRRSHPVEWQAEVARADFRFTMVTDQFRLANELLVMAGGHRVIRVLNGRSVAELEWLASCIDSCFTMNQNPK